MIFRKLNIINVKQYIELLKELTEVQKLHSSMEECCVWSYIASNKTTLLAYENNELIGAISVLFEQKFAHGGKYVAHIEDLVVTQRKRGEGIGQKLVEEVKRICKERGNVYKIILNCQGDLQHFYEKCGFNVSGLEMRADL